MDADNLFSKYSEKKYFNKIISLTAAKDLDWSFFSKELPLLPRGWYELAHLNNSDRVEFTRDYWLSKLGESSSEIEESIINFFLKIDEIDIIATQESAKTAFEIHMIYSLKNNLGFFHGSPPASKDSIEFLKRQFVPSLFPKDYLSFLEIHDGFCQYFDTGIIKIKDMAKTYQKFQMHLDRKSDLYTLTGYPIQKRDLIPFYESPKPYSYQCFYNLWVVEEEVGNVFYSEEGHWISDFLDSKNLLENLAFCSFVEWFVCYLEDVFS